MKILINKIINENPTFVLLLGLCPALAVTTKFESAYMMGICVLVVLIFSNITISLLKKIIPNNVRIPICVLIIGTFVTITELILFKYAPNLYQSLGIYLPLIVVNCIILGRALNVATKEGVKSSLIDAMGIGFGFLLALMLIACIREIFGTGLITLMDSLSSITGYTAIYQVIPNIGILPINIFVEPAGAFITLAFLIALFTYFKNKKVGDIK